MGRRALPRFIERSWVLGLLLCVAGSAIIWLAGVWQGAVAVVVANLGGAVVTVGILSFLYDPFLKDVLAQEIFEKLAVRDSVVKAGLRDISSRGELDLAELLRSATRVTVVPLDPLDWARRQFATVLQHAKDRPLQVKIYISAPDAEWVAALSRRLVMDSDALRKALEKLPDQLTESWDSEPRAKGATLAVHWVQGVPAIGITQTDQATVVELGPSLRYPTVDRATDYLVFGQSAPMSKSVELQLRFPNEAEPPVAGIRPLGRVHPALAASPGTPEPQPSHVDDAQADGSQATSEDAPGDNVNGDHGGQDGS